MKTADNINKVCFFILPLSSILIFYLCHLSLTGVNTCLTSRHQLHHFRDNFSGYPFEMTRNTATMYECTDRMVYVIVYQV